MSSDRSRAESVGVSVYDLTQDSPFNLAEVGARYGEAGPRYAIEFFPDA